jgi:hypothetical protein
MLSTDLDWSIVSINFNMSQASNSSWQRRFFSERYTAKLSRNFLSYDFKQISLSSSCGSQPWRQKAILISLHIQQTIHYIVRVTNSAITKTIKEQIKKPSALCKEVLSGDRPHKCKITVWYSEQCPYPSLGSHASEAKKFYSISTQLIT